MTHRQNRFNPLVIIQRTGENDDFNGEAPDGSLEEDLDTPSIIRFDNRNNAGKFAPGLDREPTYDFVSIKRIWADFKDATSWSIDHVYEEYYKDGSDLERNITNSNNQNTPILIETDKIMGPFEYIRMTSSGSSGNLVAEVFFDLIARN